MPRVASVSTAQTLAEKMTPNTNSGRSLGERNAGARFIEGGSRKECAERSRTPPSHENRRHLQRESTWAVAPSEPPYGAGNCTSARRRNEREDRGTRRVPRCRRRRRGKPLAEQSSRERRQHEKQDRPQRARSSRRGEHGTAEDVSGEYTQG